MSVERTYVVRENSYDTILRITVQCFGGDPVIAIDRFKVKNSYGDKLLDDVMSKLDTPLLIDITTNLRIVDMLNNTAAYTDDEETELKI